jgi:hypothetical protein
MSGIAHRVVLLGCLLFAADVLATVSIAPIGGGNALSQPAQRHVVRLDTPGRGAVWLLALQQDGQQGRGLGFFRSDDEGTTWRHYAPIQGDGSHRDTADLLPVGLDVALVYSHEPRSAAVSGSERHDVYFQWWRYQAATHAWVPEPPVRVFDSLTFLSGYVRAQLARDSQGRLWVQSFRLEPDGSNTAVIAVSQDGGLTFQPQPPLAQTPHRGGGRLLHLGDRLLLLYGDHGVSAARYRVRLDTAEVDAWGPVQVAFPEGLYHGSAMSAVATGKGGMHLVYKDVTERLLYRAFDGSTFGAPVALEPSGDWALQPATTLVGDDLVVFDNPPVSLGANYRLAARVLSGGRFGPVQVLESTSRFRGYPAAAERLPASVARVPCFYGETADANMGGSAAVTFLERTLGVEVVHTNTTHRFLAVAPSGTAYALKSDDEESRLYESTDDARTWHFKARLPGGHVFRVMSALSDGTLLANTSSGRSHSLFRSADAGATWREVLSLGSSRMSTPHGIAELDGTVYLLEYQSSTNGSAPIRLHASLDRGQTWQVRHSFTSPRHGYGLAVDPVRHALWAFFGDTKSQTGTFRSTDAGGTWQLVLGGQKGNVVDGVVLDDGSLLFGQDSSFLPERPHIVQLTPSGLSTELYLLPGPATSTHAIRGGGFVVGTARAPGRNLSPPSEVSAHVVGSLDGVTWEELLRYSRLDANEDVRADVYFELPSGLLVLQLENAQGFGPSGQGYQLLRPLWR